MSQWKMYPGTVQMLLRMDWSLLSIEKMSEQVLATWQMSKWSVSMLVAMERGRLFGENMSK